MSDEIKKWKLQEREALIETRIFEVGATTCTHPDHEHPAKFWYVAPPDWANIIALTDEDEIILVRQYRHGTQQITLEIPGGMVDPGEDPEAAAARELREETGYLCERWEKLGEIAVNPAFMTNHCTTWLGTGAKLLAQTDFDEHEELSVEVYSVEQFFSMIDDGVITHGIVVSAAFYLKRYLERRGR